MARLVLFVVALGALAYLGYRSLGSDGSAPEAERAPARQLERVRGAADRIEQQQQQRADDDLEQTR